MGSFRPAVSRSSRGPRQASTAAAGRKDRGRRPATAAPLMRPDASDQPRLPRAGPRRVSGAGSSCGAVRVLPSSARSGRPPRRRRGPRCRGRPRPRGGLPAPATPSTRRAHQASPAVVDLQAHPLRPGQRVLDEGLGIERVRVVLGQGQHAGQVVPRPRQVQGQRLLGHGHRRRAAGGDPGVVELLPVSSTVLLSRRNSTYSLEVLWYQRATSTRIARRAGCSGCRPSAGRRRRCSPPAATGSR